MPPAAGTLGHALPPQPLSPLAPPAAAEWRLNPFLLPYAWATDKEGWQVLAASEEVMQCYGNTWDARYYAGASAGSAWLSGLQTGCGWTPAGPLPRCPRPPLTLCVCPALAPCPADAGAALALLGAGYNIDTLLTKLQGVDWWNQRTWDCNQRRACVGLALGAPHRGSTRRSSPTARRVNA